MSETDDVRHAAELFAVDPQGTGGVALRARHGPDRDAWLAYLRSLLGDETGVHRVPLHIADNRLLGGLDLTATLHAGRPVAERGVLAIADGGVIVLCMAERLTAATAARITAALDTREARVERDGIGSCAPARWGVVALDEGAEADEQPPPALLDRLAFHVLVEPRSITQQGLAPASKNAQLIEAARQRLRFVEVDDAAVRTLTQAALELGIVSLRAPLLALRVARAAAALQGSGLVQAEHIATAARLVLAPRATRWPQSAAEPDAQSDDTPRDESAADEPPADEDPTLEPQTRPDDARDPDERAERSPSTQSAKLDDVVLAAIQSALPPELLAALRPQGSARPRSASSGRTGPLRSASGRGRPAGVKAGSPQRGDRLNVVETLRAAAPWQRLRRGQGSDSDPGDDRRLAIRSGDFRVTRLKRRRQTTTVFAVDASGSTAFQRLADAKGAVELLLAECYVRRDQVALLAFRGKRAELLLPPTRSLSRAKRCLAALPGGGGTPLASGIDSARLIAEGVRRRGDTPIIVVLTDGGANIARDGRPGRSAAEADAIQSARALRATRTPVLLVDTATRPQPAARRLATELGAQYLALPHADAAAISRAAGAATKATLRA